MWKIGDCLPRGLSYYPRIADPVGIYVRLRIPDPDSIRKFRYLGSVHYFRRFASGHACFESAIAEYRLLLTEHIPCSRGAGYNYTTSDGRSPRYGTTMPLGAANKTGIVGIRQDIREYPLKSGGVSIRRAWIAFWTENGISNLKSFGYGGFYTRFISSDTAKQRAIEYRAKMVKEHYSKEN